MIVGRFGDTSGRPFVEGRLYLPRLGIQGNISFLLDTGADSSMIMPGDAKKLGINYNDLQGDTECVGVGGPVHYYVERALVAFSDPGEALHIYELPELGVMHDDPQMENVHSLLGRDIIDRWRITYDPQGSRLNIKVVLSDIVYDLKSSPPLSSPP